MSELLLNTSYIVDKLCNDPITVVDGGARGEVFPPLDKLNEHVLQVLRFDPDPNAKFTNKGTQDITYHKALWARSGELPINIAVEPSASSVHEFNHELQALIDPHEKLRKTKTVITAKSLSLDDLLNDDRITTIDFIKLDVHGAEYEILQGANQALNATLGLLIESWLLPIHKGQKLHGHVESYLNNKGFYTFEEWPRAVWPRKVKGFSKSQVVALDTLYFTDPIIDHSSLTETSAIKLVGLANLFNHNAFALQLNSYFSNRSVYDIKTAQYISDRIKKHQTNRVKAYLLKKVTDLYNRLSDCTFR